MTAPIRGGRIGWPFHAVSSQGNGLHQGVDYPCPVGTPILAVADGLVYAVGQFWGPYYGTHSVLVLHKLNDRNVWGIYAHASRYLVERGQTVKLGQVIAFSGAEGNVTGPHLHFEIQAQSQWHQGAGIDPQPLLDEKPAVIVPPIGINLVKETDQISLDEFRLLAAGQRLAIPHVTRKWGKPDVLFSHSDKRRAGWWNVVITDENAKANAYGFHQFDQATRLPVAYISPTMSGLTKDWPQFHDVELWGIPGRPAVKVAGRVVIPATDPIPGLAAIVFHEIAEMIVDPELTFWAIGHDNQEWLVEVGDQAQPNHFTVEAVTTLLCPGRVKVGAKWVAKLIPTPVRRTMVLADFTLPSFYDLAGKPPFSHTGLVTVGPFGHPTGSRAYIKDANGATMNQYAADDDRL